MLSEMASRQHSASVRRWVASIAVGVSLLAGCSAEERFYPVSGTVLVKGVKADNAQVTFHPVDPKTLEGINGKPMGFADPEGKFVITTESTGDGAPPGEYVVTIEWHDRAEGAFDGGTPDKLRGKYADPSKSTLRATVEQKVNELAPFELK